MVRCTPCSGRTQLKVFGCAVHGRCHPTTREASLACCQGCPDYQRLSMLAEPVVRNLLYHVYPVRGHVWRWNVEQLLRRIELFNGRRIVAVCYDAFTDPPEEVERALGDNVDEVIRLPNIPELREVNSFLPLFSRVQSRHPSHCTLYAHAKGVSRPGHTSVEGWAKILYETLDYWPAIEEMLGTYPVVGSFKKLGAGWYPHESSSQWHYSGSWVWMRNRDLFSKPDWQRIDRFWSGIEPWVSLHFGAGEAGTLFYEAPVLRLNMYDVRFFQQVIMPAWEVWKAEHIHHYRPGGLIHAQG